MATKYNVDINKITKPGNVLTSGIRVVDASGNGRESFFACRGTGSGNVVIYDKVLYELVLGSISNVGPEGGTFTISNYATTNKKTHGNNVVETGLSLSPSAITINANTSTGSTKSGSTTVTQYDSALGKYSGASTTLKWTQVKDYPTGITLTISPKSTIPASGGTISSALTNYTYSVTCNYKSGNNNVSVTNSCTITANKSGVTANSKETTTGGTTTAGTISFTASYTCNGYTVTSSKSVNIIQDANAITSYDNPSFTLSPGNTTLPASGGSVTGALSGSVTQVRRYTSKASATITLTAGTGTNSYTSAWTSQTITCESRGTTTGASTTLGTTSLKITSKNGGSTTKSYTVYQEKNEIKSYDAPTFTLSPGTTTLPASGGSVTGSVSNVKQVRNYTSNATDTITISSPSIAWSSQTITCESRGKTTGSTTTLGTTYAKVTSNSKSTTKSYVVYQGANQFPSSTSWGDLVVSAATLTCSDVPCTGGTVYPASGGTVYQNRRRYYTSGSYTDDIPSVTATCSLSKTSFSGNNLHKTTKSRTSLGTTKATWTGNSSKTGTKTITVYQAANNYTDSWNTPTVTVTQNPSGQISYAAQTVYITASASQSGKRTWCTTEYDTLSGSSFTYTWTESGSKTGFTATTNGNTCTVSCSQNSSTSSRNSNNYCVKAIGSGSKESSSVCTYLTQSAGAKGSVTKLSAIVTNNNPPSSGGSISIRVLNNTNTAIDVSIELLDNLGTIDEFSYNGLSAGGTYTESLTYGSNATSVSITYYNIAGPTVNASISYNGNSVTGSVVGGVDDTLTLSNVSIGSGICQITITNS